MKPLLPVLVAGVLAAPAAASAAWSPPTTTGTASNVVFAPGIALTRAGPPVLTAAFAGDDHRLFAGDVRRSVTGLVVDPLAIGAGGVLLVRSTRPLTRPGLTVQIGDARGSLGQRRTLSRDVVANSAAAAANARGDAAVAFTELDRRRGRTRVRLAVKRAGRAFGAPATVATGLVGVPTSGNGDAGGVTVALGARGELVVAYQRERGRRGRARTVEARTGTVGRKLSRARRLGPQQGSLTLASRIGPNGRIAVAWRTQDTGEEANEAQRVHAALRGPGARGFRRSQVLDPGGPAARGLGTIALTLAPDGTTTVAWSSIRGSFREGLAFPVRAAVAPPGAPFAPQQELFPSGALGDVVTDGTGAAVAVFTEFETGPRFVPARVLAATRPAGAAAFAPAEQVAGPEAGEDVRAATDPRTGRVTAVWGGRALRSSTRG